MTSLYIFGKVTFMNEDEKRILDENNKDDEVQKNKPRTKLFAAVEERSETTQVIVSEQPANDVVFAPTVEGEENVAESIAEDERKLAEKTMRKHMFGDRAKASKKIPKWLGRIIAVGVLIAIVVILFVKFPLFYNCVTPPSTDRFNTYVEGLSLEVWEGVLGKPTDEYPANFAEINETNGAEQSAKGGVVFVDDETKEKKFANIYCYQFKNKSESKTYANFVKDSNVQHEGDVVFKNAIYSMGSVWYSTDNYYYLGWFCGNMFIEVYASDKGIAELIRGDINSYF